MFLEPIIALIQNAGIGVVGKTLFQDFMPPQVRVGVLVLNPLGGNSINWEIGQNYRREDVFQVISRGGSVAEARPPAIAIYNLLTMNLADQILPATSMTPELQIKYIRPKQDPITYPRQIDGLWEVSLNFVATYAINPVPGNYVEDVNNNLIEYR